MKTQTKSALILLCICLCTLLVSCKGSDKVSNSAENNTNFLEEPAKNTDVPQNEQSETEGEWTVTKTGSVTCNGIGSSYDNAIIYKIGNKTGIIDNRANTLIEPSESFNAFPVSSEYLIAESEDSSENHLITFDGDIVASFPKYEGIFNRGDYILCQDSKNGHFVFSIKDKKVVAKTDFTQNVMAFYVLDDCFIIRNWDYLEVYDKNGNKLASDFAEYNLAFEDFVPREWVKWVTDEGAFSVIEGKVITEDDFATQEGKLVGLHGEYINSKFQIYHSRNKNSGKSGLVSFSGKVIIPHEYDTIYIYDNGIVAVGLEDDDEYYYGFYNYKGEKLTDCIYTAVGTTFRSGFLDVCMNGYWGFIDESTTLVHPTNIKRDGVKGEYAKTRYTYVDQNNTRVINPKTGEIRTYQKIEFNSFLPEDLFLYYKSNTVMGLSSYEKELFEIECESIKDVYISFTLDGKVMIVKEFNDYTFYEIAKK